MAPSHSEAQARYMAMIAHGGKPRGGGGPSVAVAKEFNESDAGTGILSRAMKKASRKRTGLAMRAKPTSSY